MCLSLSPLSLPCKGANVYDILRRKALVLTVGAVKQLSARLAAPVRRRPWANTQKKS